MSQGALDAPQYKARRHIGYRMPGPFFISNKKQFIVSGTALLLAIVGLLVAPLLFGEGSKPALASANGLLSCGSAQYTEYNKYMVLAGEMTIGRMPAQGTLSQQQTMIDNYEALDLPKDKTIFASGHLPTGKVYTTQCANERCTMEEVSKSNQACMMEHWRDCTYLAAQFRQKTYCFLSPAQP